MNTFLDARATLRALGLPDSDAGDPSRTISLAARNRAVERHPIYSYPRFTDRAIDEDHDGGKDGCLPAARRHHIAAILVAEISCGARFDIGLEGERDICDARLVVLALLGATDLYDPIPCQSDIDYDCGIDVYTLRMIDFAIRLVCDETYDFPQIAVRVVSEYLLYTRGETGSRAKINTMIARARRALDMIAARA